MGPAISLHYDNSERENHSHQGNNLTKTIDIDLENDWENTYDPLTAGLSIVFLKFISSRNSLIEVQITKEYSHGVNTNDTITQYTILPNVQLPTTSFDPVNVVKSYPEHGEQGRVGRITVRLTLSQWDSSNQLYFTVTSYKLGKAGHTRQECSELRSAGNKKRWWDCNKVSSEDNVLCINYDLTCDYLPNCAKLNVPNPDENCISNGVQAALQLLVYCLLTIFLVLLIAGCTRCCLRGFCLRSTLHRRNSDIIEIINEDECRRPDNSPPSYDDAMKYVNDAFENSDSEAPPAQSAPSTYSRPEAPSSSY